MILIIDHYDSFVHILARYIDELGADWRMHRYDRIDINAMCANPPDGIIFSPGPATPQKAAHSIELVKAIYGLCPLLGVCLGHQIIAAAFGELEGRDDIIARAPAPIHGAKCDVHHNHHGLFAGLPNPFPAARYHALSIRTMPRGLKTIAQSADGVNMALANDEHAIYGVQFHPESILTPLGKIILKNFLTLSQNRPPQKVA